LLHHDEKILHIKSLPNGELGHPRANMSTLWGPPCTITDVKFYISSTASKRIAEILEFFPHNSPMPHLSSTNRLLMDTNEMDNAFKHPHPEVPFAQVGDDTITALAQLATIFNFSIFFQKPSTPELIQAPLKAAENKQPAALAHPILFSPMQTKY
jgi:hypothetical protein